MNLGSLVVAVVSIVLVATACTSRNSRFEAGNRIGSGVTAPPSSSSTPNPDALPSTLPIEDKHACDIVDEDVAATVDVADPQRGRVHNNWGSVCSYTTPEVYLFVLLTDGPSQGLAELSTDRGEIQSLTVGPFPARQEADGPLCTFDVEVEAGRALRVRYETRRQDEDPCDSAKSLATEGLVLLAEESAPGGPR